MPLVTTETGYNQTGSTYSKLQKFIPHCTEPNTVLRALSLKSCMTQHILKQLVCFIRNTVKDLRVSQYRFVCIYSHLSPFMCHGWMTGIGTVLPTFLFAFCISVSDLPPTFSHFKYGCTGGCHFSDHGKTRLHPDTETREIQEVTKSLHNLQPTVTVPWPWTQLPVNIFNPLILNHLFFKWHPSHTKDHHHQSQLCPKRPGS